MNNPVFWTLFIQSAIITYLCMFIGAGLSWWARKGQPEFDEEE
ncbi:MAG: hypothetical protein ACK5JR_10360 [Tropicimonas sp.]